MPALGDACSGVPDIDRRRQLSTVTWSRIPASVVAGDVAGELQWGVEILLRERVVERHRRRRNEVL
ncbi:MAG: hypothetical protein WAM81_05485 [Acidimicrobiia bacterium]